MGAVESRAHPELIDSVITRVVENKAQNDLSIEPCIEKLRSLKLNLPLLKASAQSILKNQQFTVSRDKLEFSDIENLKLDSKSTETLILCYIRWHLLANSNLKFNQELIHLKFDEIEGLLIKLLQRINMSAKVMKSNAVHLQEASTIKSDILDLRAQMVNVATNYSKLCDRLGELNFIQTEDQGQAQTPLPLSSMPTSQTVTLSGPDLVSPFIDRYPFAPNLANINPNHKNNSSSDKNSNDINGSSSSSNNDNSNFDARFHNGKLRSNSSNV